VHLSGKARRAAIEILRHLKAQPEAKDTLEGIRHWWLDAGDLGVEDVRQAANVLVAEGFLRVWEPSPGLQVFGSTTRFLENPAAAIEVLETGE
jgi:hypothetical protein